jgi:AraC family transcriptional regulator
MRQGSDPNQTWTVEASNSVPAAIVELRRYRFATPCSISEEAPSAIFSMNLPRPGGTRGTIKYDAGACPPQKIGAMILQPANVPIHSTGEGGALRVLRCEFDADYFGSKTTLSDWDPSRLKKCAAIESPPLADATKHLLRELINPSFGSSLMVEIQVQWICVEIARYFMIRTSSERSVGGLAPWQLNRIRDMFESATHYWPTIAEIASECRISRSHLSRAFTKSTGITLVEYAGSLRVARAKELLEQSTFSMSEISALLGFAHSSAFSNAFRRATGVTPLQYSRLVQSH